MMMATEQRLISLNDLMKFPIRINHYDKEHGNEHFVLGIESVLEYAEQLPTIEARPVVHGRWENPSKYGLSTMMDKLGNVCSACASYCDNRFNYCPSCGAQMNRGTE